MELRLTNGATVTRVWNDSSTELLAGFQFRDDAVGFAQAKLAQDASHNLWNSSYIVANHYDGALQIIAHPKEQKQKAAA